MKETKNYKLNLPQDTDYVDIEDFNSNFNNIDNIVKENNESVNNNIKNNNKNIIEIKNKVTELEKKIGSGSSDSSSSGSEIDEGKLNEIKQELNKKIDDFIDTKDKSNGIAGLDEEGKVKKEQLPKIEGVKIAKGVYIGTRKRQIIQTGFKPAYVIIQQQYGKHTQTLLNASNATWDNGGYCVYYKIIDNGFELGLDSIYPEEMNDERYNYSYIAIG